MALRVNPAETVFELWLALPWDDRLSVFDAESRSLEDAGRPRPDVVTRRSAAQRRAIDALVQAAHALGKDDGDRPLTIAKYEAATSGDGSAMSPSGIVRAFGTWGRAAAAARGLRIPAAWSESASKRALAQRRRAYADPLVCLHYWLETSPPSKRWVDYDDYARAINSTTDLPVRLLGAGAITSRLCIYWPDAVAIGEGRMSLDEASKHPRLLRIRGLDEGPLAGISTIARLHNRTRSTVQLDVDRPSFPAPKVWIGGSRAWAQTDVSAWYAGQPFRSKPLKEIYQAADLATHLGLSLPSVRVYISKGRFDRVPRPAGRVCGRWWWWRVDVTRFARDRPPGRGSSRSARTPARNQTRNAKAPSPTSPSDAGTESGSGDASRRRRAPEPTPSAARATTRTRPPSERDQAPTRTPSRRHRGRARYNAKSSPADDYETARRSDARSSPRPATPPPSRSATTQRTG
jgi:hypothetical protein